jgi:hypothetical protein
MLGAEQSMKTIQRIPLSGGARAVRPWGWLWGREGTHPGAPATAVAPRHRSKEGIFAGVKACRFGLA